MHHTHFYMFLYLLFLFQETSEYGDESYTPTGGGSGGWLLIGAAVAVVAVVAFVVFRVFKNFQKTRDREMEEENAYSNKKKK